MANRFDGVQIVDHDTFVQNMLLDGEDHISVACWIVNNGVSSMDLKAMIIQALNTVKDIHGVG